MSQCAVGITFYLQYLITQVDLYILHRLLLLSDAFAARYYKYLERTVDSTGMPSSAWIVQGQWQLYLYSLPHKRNINSLYAGVFFFFCSLILVCYLSCNSCTCGACRNRNTPLRFSENRNYCAGCLPFVALIGRKTTFSVKSLAFKELRCNLVCGSWERVDSLWRYILQAWIYFQSTYIRQTTKSGIGTQIPEVTSGV